MQTAHSKNRLLIFYVLAFIFVFGYCSSTSFGVVRHNAYYDKTITPAVNTHSHQLLAHWLKSKESTKTIESLPPTEIWGRIRQRLNFNTVSGSPLIQHHIKNITKHRDYINLILANASPYLFYVLEEVEKRGMPSEIALLPMIESTFNPHTISTKGAVGLWQIMPQLGRLYGLKQNAWYDGRKDIYESTKVALDHLEYLHKRFNGNWLLALAAYNSGESRVLNAISKNKSAKKATDFWSLSLPKETQHYVPKLLAMATLIKSPKQFGLVLPAIPNQALFARVNIGKAIDMAQAAKLVDSSEKHLRTLNPGLHKKTMNPKGPFHLVVPVHHAHVFNKQPAANQSFTLAAAINSQAHLVSANKSSAFPTAAAAKETSHLKDVKITKTGKSPSKSKGKSHSKTKGKAKSKKGS